MTNLWEETLRELATYGKTFKDVKYIQGSDFAITKENFEQVAKKSEYYSGFGTAKVAEDLVIVGDDWWLERHEYDGSEWWEYKDVKLDAVITDVEFGEPEAIEEDEGFGEYTMRNTVTIYHNQNPIAIADCEADAGNGGYYYSVCSLVIKNVHYKVVEA